MKKNKYLKSLGEVKKTAKTKGTESGILIASVIGASLGQNIVTTYIKEPKAQKFIGLGTMALGVAGKMFAKDSNIEAVAEGFMASGAVQVFFDFGEKLVPGSTSKISFASRNISVVTPPVVIYDENGNIMTGFGRVDWSAIYEDAASNNAFSGNEEENTNVEGLEEKSIEELM